jgi:hypothetical protein
MMLEQLSRGGTDAAVVARGEEELEAITFGALLPIGCRGPAIIEQLDNDPTRRALRHVRPHDAAAVARLQLEQVRTPSHRSATLHDLAKSSHQVRTDIASDSSRPAPTQRDRLADREVRACGSSVITPGKGRVMFSPWRAPRPIVEVTVQ